MVGGGIKNSGKIIHKGRIKNLDEVGRKTWGEGMGDDRVKKGNWKVLRSGLAGVLTNKRKRN